MARKKEIPEGVFQLTLSEIPFGSMIKINGNDYQFKGFEKRKTKFGIQQHFIFYSEKVKHERIFERFSYSNIKIKKINGNYEW